MLLSKISLLLFISSCLELHAVDIYYISSDAQNSSCTVNGTVLHPCYSLDQLSNGSQLLANRIAVTLLLAQSPHVLQGDYISAANLTELRLLPWNTEEVSIQCKPRGKFVFENVQHLLLSHTRFISCTFQMVRKCHRGDYTPLDRYLDSM